MAEMNLRRLKTVGRVGGRDGTQKSLKDKDKSCLRQDCQHFFFFKGVEGR